MPGGVTLVPGSGGIFDVTLIADGNRTLFSKEDKGRFPEPGEVEEKLTKLFEAGSR